MTREEIKNTPEIVDFMLDKSVIADSRMKLHKRLEELCELAIKALEREPCCNCIEFKRYAKEMGFEIEQEPILDKIRTIVDEWQSDTWTDNLSYECMIKIAELIEPQEVRNKE